jgi:hypothetical protein
MLLPVKAGDTLAWKIWILNTTLDDLEIHPENESLLKGPGRKLDSSDDLKTIETDVVIIGGGNA